MYSQFVSDWFKSILLFQIRADLDLIRNCDFIYSLAKIRYPSIRSSKIRTAVNPLQFAIQSSNPMPTGYHAYSDGWLKIFLGVGRIEDGLMFVYFLFFDLKRNVKSNIDLKTTFLLCH